MRTELEIAEAITRYTETFKYYDTLNNPKIKVSKPKNANPNDLYLREIAKDLGISVTKKNPDPNAKRKQIERSREELIEVIWQLLESKRQEMLSVNEYGSVKEELIGFGNKIWSQIQSYVNDLRKPNTDDYRDVDGGLGLITVEMVRGLETRRNTDGELLASTTVTKYMGDLKTLIKQRLKTYIQDRPENTVKAYQNVVNTLLGYTYEEETVIDSKGTKEIRTKYKKGWVDDAMKTHTQVKNAIGSQKKDERSEKASQIRTINLVAWADNLLTNIESPDLKANAWIDVTVAVGLMTGRRMSEIVTKGDAFEATESDPSASGQYLMFKKQLKSKNDEPVEPYEIPVLCTALKILKAEKWLETNGKKYDESRRGTYSKSISDAMSKYDSIIQYVEREERDGKVQKLHFHSLRKIYAQVIGERKGSQDRLTKIAIALGDTVDAKTASTYASDYQVLDAVEIMNIWFKQPTAPAV